MLRRALGALFRSATTPANTTIYAVGDCHGYLDAVEAMGHKIDADRAKTPSKKIFEIYLGDYINRGPQSREVIDYLIERSQRQDGVKRAFIKGNHEVIFQDFLLGDHINGGITPEIEGFFSYGGIETLASYGVAPRLALQPEPRRFESVLVRGTNFYLTRSGLLEMQKEMLEKIPSSHLLFLEGLKTKLDSGKYIFVHAGIDPALPLDAQTARTLTGVSNKVREFSRYTGKVEDNKVIVHGHVVSEKPYSTSNQIGVDTGVYREGFGKLSCAVLTGNDVKFLQTSTAMPAYDAKSSPALAQLRALANP